MSAGPDPRDVAELTRLFGLMRDFPSDEQRARYLLTSNWLRERGAEAARINAEQLAAVQTASPAGGNGAYRAFGDFPLWQRIGAILVVGSAALSALAVLAFVAYLIMGFLVVMAP
jgi:hypothetical protein